MLFKLMEMSIRSQMKVTSKPLKNHLCSIKALFACLKVSKKREASSLKFLAILLVDVSRGENVGGKKKTFLSRVLSLTFQIYQDFCKLPNQSSRSQAFPTGADIHAENLDSKIASLVLNRYPSWCFCKLLNQKHVCMEWITQKGNSLILHKNLRFSGNLIGHKILFNAWAPTSFSRKWECILGVLSIFNFPARILIHVYVFFVGKRSSYVHRPQIYDCEASGKGWD